MCQTALLNVKNIVLENTEEKMLLEDRKIVVTA